MIQQKESRPDLRKEGRGRKKPMTTDDIRIKDITLKVSLPGNLQRRKESTKLNKQSLIRIMIADNPKLAKLEYWKVERMFNKMSKRQQENIAKNRKWFPTEHEYPKPEDLPKEYLQAPYFHIPLRQSEAVKILRLTEEQVASFINPEIYPSRFIRKTSDWEKMTPRQRLLFHLSQIAEGYPYQWDYVE